MTDITRDDAVKAAVVFSGDEVRAAWAQGPAAHLDFVSTNKQYRALPRNVWDEILSLRLTPADRYEPEFFDCDAFAAAFMGLVVWDFDINGVCRVLDNSAHHSYNAILVVSADGKSCNWELVEPQLDKIVGEPGGPVVITKSGENMYKATDGFAVTA